jgi:DNA repair protein RecO (recombination protein O)
MGLRAFYLNQAPTRCENSGWNHCHVSSGVIENRILHGARSVGNELRFVLRSARRQRMPARETEAIILKTFPLGEADRLVSFFGRSSGRMRGVASGARRLKNRFGSTLELLSHVQIWYFERETRDLVRVHQCELLESFHRAQSDYGLSTGLALVSETAELVLPENEASEPMFRLILMVVREIERRSSWKLALSYFAFWTVRVAGWLPRLDACSFCGKLFGMQAAYQSVEHPGLLCEEHRRPGMKAVACEVRGVAEIFARERLDKLDAALESNPWVGVLREAGLNWIEHHSERKLQTRELLETV